MTPDTDPARIERPSSGLPRLAWVAAFSLAIALVPQTGRAQTRTWTGGGGNLTWSTTGNWSGNAAPTSTTPVVFDSTSTTLTPTISAAANAKSIAVVNPSGAITISNTNTLTLAGGIDLSSATQDLSIGTLITAGTLVSNTTGSLTIAAGRTLTIGTKLLRFNGGALSTITINGAGAIVIAGTSTGAAGVSGVDISVPLTVASGSFFSPAQFNVTQPVTIQGGYLGMNDPSGSQNFVIGSSATTASFTQTSGTSFFSRFQLQKAPATISGGTAWLGGLQMATVSATSALTITGNASVSGTWGNTGNGFGSAANALASIMLSGGTFAMNSMPTSLGSGASRSITFDGGVYGPQVTGAVLTATNCNAFVTSNGAIVDTFGLNASIPQVLANGTAPGTAGPFTKRGAGTLTLGGVSTFSGTTTVAGGTLLVSGTGNLAGTARAVINGSGAELAWISAASPTAPIDITVGTLSGTGTLGGLVTAAAGGILSAGTGAAPGTLTANGGLSLDTASVLNFDLNPADTTAGGGINDLIVVGGNFTLGGILNVSGTGDWTTLADNTTWRLFDYSGGSFTANSVTIGTQPTLGAGKSFVVDTSTANQVNLIVVPEPTTVTISIAATAGLAAMMTRRKRS